MEKKFNLRGINREDVGKNRDLTEIELAAAHSLDHSYTI